MSQYTQTEEDIEYGQWQKDSVNKRGGMVDGKPLLVAVSRLDASIDALDKALAQAWEQLEHLVNDNEPMKESDTESVPMQSRSATTARVDQMADRVDHAVRHFSRLLRIIEA